MNNIYITGFMGTGKTSAGSLLAKKLHRVFLDLDRMIEEREKQPVRGIFGEKGEEYFRDREQEMLDEVSGGKNQVVSCGGGIVVRECNIERMKASGIIICLSASVDAIMERTAGRAHRPLLNTPDPARTIRELLVGRASCYARADAGIDTTGLSVEQVVERIMAVLSSHGKP